MRGTGCRIQEETVEQELERLVRMVIEMREAQKAYFATRTQPRLRQALALEQEVDRRLLEWLHGGVQGTLMDGRR